MPPTPAALSSMTNPKVSILVPVYGVEQYIERCAISLFEQTYDNIEYIFVNDATRDDSIAVLNTVINRYPHRKHAVRIIHHPQNKGLSAARNTAIAHSTGEYILHVDSDDYLSLDAIAHLTAKALQTRADIVLFDTNILTDNGIITEQVGYTDKQTYIKGLLQHTAKCAHWNKFYRGDFYRQSGIQSCEDIRLAEDYAITPRLVHAAQTIAVLHEPLYFYETRNQSSYVHNLTRSAIESQYRADKVLVDWFRKVQDADTYRNIVNVLPVRSMVSLIKRSDRPAWQEILDIYHEYLNLSGKGMTMVNRIIYHLARHHDWATLQCFMHFYHLVMQDNQ